MTIANPSFETTDTAFREPGIAASWSRNSRGTGEERATISGDAAATASGYESFEHGWSAVDPQALVPTLTQVAHGITEAMQGWYGHVDFMAIGVASAAVFDNSTQAVEDFTGGWGAIDADLTLDSLEVVQAQFDGHAIETFAWAPVVTTLGSVSTAWMADEAIAEVFDVSLWTEES